MFRREGLGAGVVEGKGLKGRVLLDGARDTRDRRGSLTHLAFFFLLVLHMVVTYSDTPTSILKMEIF